MAEKTKKKPGSLFIFKRWNSQRAEDGPSSPLSADVPAGPFFKVNAASSSAIPKASGVNAEQATSKLSAGGGIKDLVQCTLCLEVLHNHKMLPCQHTFCMACITVYIADKAVIDCPICETRINITSSNFINELPSNLYIDSLIKLMTKTEKPKLKTEEPKLKAASVPASPSKTMKSVDLFAAGVRCSHCQSMCDNADVTSCRHCKLSFCRVCWSQHLEDMKTQIGSILKQLESASGRLDHKVEHYKDCFDHIMEQINVAAEEKINAILEAKQSLLTETASLQKNGDLTALALRTTLNETINAATKAMADRDEEIRGEDQVALFINLHQNALQILSDVSKWDAECVVFDKQNFKLERDDATPLDAESDDPLPVGGRQKDPLENEDSLVMYYRSRNFVPHYKWRKASRPGGVAVSPWDNHLYVCGMDSHCVLVVERSQAKIVARLTCEDMLCPVHIAFLKSAGEIYVTDKWKHCIHVFSKEGEHLRSIGQKGSRAGMFRSPEGIETDDANHLIYVVDTGNDRVQILQPDGTVVGQIGVATKQQISHTSPVWETKDVTCTELNGPTDIAVTNDRVIILDSGNRRVKIYNKSDRGKIAEFGSLGQRKGQFRQPEVLAVDPMGFILVGDSGNCRVQVFKPNGQLVRVFGRMGHEPGNFGWISGIHITKQLDIIISDTKTHSVNFF